MIAILQLCPLTVINGFIYHDSYITLYNYIYIIIYIYILYISLVIGDIISFKTVEGHNCRYREIVVLVIPVLEHFAFLPLDSVW